MSKLNGRKGALYVDIPGIGAPPVKVVNQAQWTFDNTVATQDVTSMGDDNMEYVSGLPDSKGTFSGFLDDTEAQLYQAARDGKPRAWILYSRFPDLGWYGPAAIFDQSSAGGVAEVVTVTGNFKAAGPVYEIGDGGPGDPAGPGGVPVLIASSPPSSIGTAPGDLDYTFTASGATPITWSIATGNLPAWASLNPSTGFLHDTGTIVAGSFTFTVKATNAAGSATSSGITIIAA